MPAASKVRAIFRARLEASRTAIKVGGKPMTKAEFIRRLNAEAGTTYNEGNLRTWEVEEGTTMPHPRVIPSIAVVLDVTTDYLLGLDPAPSRRISPEEEAARAAAETAEAGL